MATASSASAARAAGVQPQAEAGSATVVSVEDQPGAALGGRLEPASGGRLAVRPLDPHGGGLVQVGAIVDQAVVQGAQQAVARRQGGLGGGRWTSP